LRKGVRWADGTPFSADDVMFTFMTMQSQDYQESTQQLWKDVTVAKVDDLDVKFTLKAPSAAFPLALRQGIISKHAFEKVSTAGMPRRPRSGPRAIGTAPSKVGSLSGARHVVTLDRNLFANPKPYLDHFVFQTYPTPADAIAAVSSGQADTVGDLLLQGV